MSRLLHALSSGLSYKSRTSTGLFFLILQHSVSPQCRRRSTLQICIWMAHIFHQNPTQHSFIFRIILNLLRSLRCKSWADGKLLPNIFKGCLTLPSPSQAPGTGGTSNETIAVARVGSSSLDSKTRDLLSISSEVSLVNFLAEVLPLLLCVLCSFAQKLANVSTPKGAEP